MAAPTIDQNRGAVATGPSRWLQWHETVNSVLNRSFKILVIDDHWRENNKRHRAGPVAIAPRF